MSFPRRPPRVPPRTSTVPPNTSRPSSSSSSSGSSGSSGGGSNSGSGGGEGGGTPATSGFRPARAPAPPPAPPLIPTTGEHARLDAMSTVINETAAPFMNAPPEHQGALGYVAQGLGGVLGLIQAPFTLLDTGFAMLTADIAAVFPALPAATIVTALHLGFPHGHSHPPSLIPPAPPVPLPSIGSVLLAGAVNVLINGMPAARAGDVGIAVTCCSLAPPLEIVLGSSNVFIGGARAARMLDMTRHDNPVPMGTFAKVMAIAGAAAGLLSAATQAMDSANSDAQAAAADSAAEAEAAAAAAAGQALAAALTAAQVAADAAALALQLLVGKDPGIGPGVGMITLGSPNVMIGGFPCPNLMEAIQGLMRAAKGLRRRARRNQDADDGPAARGCRSCRR